MAIELNDIIMKGNIILSTLSTASAKESESYCSESYAKNYNDFRAKALEVIPEKQGIFPPSVKATSDFPGVSEVRFIEIQTFVTEIIMLLNGTQKAKGPNPSGNSMGSPRGF